MSNPSRFSITAANAIPSEQLRQLAQTAFADYLIGPFALPAADWPLFLARQCVDLESSLVGLVDGQAQGFVLLAPRLQLQIWRVAMMGLVPQARGSGLADVLLQTLCTRAAQAQTGLELEVICHNARAERLYAKFGFVREHVLQSWLYTPSKADDGAQANSPQDAVELISCEAALTWLQQAELRIPGLPLQTCAASLLPIREQLQCLRRHHAQLIFRHMPDQSIQILSLIDEQAGQEAAQILLRAMQIRHPQAIIRLSPLQRYDLGGAALAACGFSQQELGQYLMRRPR